MQISENAMVDDEIKAYGFPSGGDNDGMPLPGKILKWHDTKSIQTELEYIGSNTNDTDVVNHLSGWSGSGLYKKDGNSLYLIGILRRLTDKDHTYQSIHCISMQTILEVMEHNGLEKFHVDEKVAPRIILFNAYDDSSEPYYLEREEDGEFIENLSVSNLWVFGKSGKGKTALINRNLLINEIDYLFCDLSPITIISDDDILEEILNTAEDKFEIKRCVDEENKIKSIVELLNRAEVKKIVIVIDEMSIEDETLLKTVASSFLRLVSHHTNIGKEKDLRFVISTREEPKTILNDISKATDYFQYICCDDWEDYLEKLFDSLCIALELNIGEKNKEYIINNSDKSPRILKKIFKNILPTKSLEDGVIKEVVKKSLEESY